MWRQSDQEDSFPSGTIWEDSAAEVLNLSEESVFPMFLSLKESRASGQIGEWPGFSQGSKRSTQALLPGLAGKPPSIVNTREHWGNQNHLWERLEKIKGTHPLDQGSWAFNCIYSLNIIKRFHNPHGKPNPSSKGIFNEPVWRKDDTFW